MKAFPWGHWIGERFVDLFQPGSHGSTFGGTPLACVAVLDVIEREQLLEKVRVRSAGWIQPLRRLAAEFPAQLPAVRGRGYLVGLQLAGDPAPCVTALRERGLLVVSAGGNVIRILPPLATTAEELARSVEILRDTLRAKA